MAKSFKDFLTERGENETRKGLSELKFLEILKEKARNSYEIIKKAPIYTEEIGEAPMMLITPHARPSKSPFWLDKLVTEHGNWKRYPNRGACLRGHSSHERYGHGENVYIVIPLDGARIGIAAEDSFYRSFKTAEKALRIAKLDNHWLSSWISNISHGINDLGKLEQKLSTEDADTYAQFKKQIHSVDEAFKKYKDVIAKNLKTEDVDDEVKLLFNDLLARHVTNLERYLEEKLDPENNGFHAVRVESYHQQPGDREVWIEDPCLLILRSKYVEFYKRGAVK